MAARVGHLRDDLAEVRRDMAELRRDVHAVSDRVARIEGALTGPWRPPANGNPRAAPAEVETLPGEVSDPLPPA